MSDSTDDVALYADWCEDDDDDEYDELIAARKVIAVIKYYRKQYCLVIGEKLEIALNEYDKELGKK